MSLFGNKTEEKKKKPAAKPAAKTAASAAAKKPSMKELYGEEGKAKAEVATGVEAKVEKQAVAKKKEASGAFHVLVKPLVTEKGSVLNASNKYLFMVDKGANKIEVAAAIQAAYGVKPVKVNIINIEGKTKRRGKVVGKRKDWKKAIVTLPEGQTIQIYEGI
jgi:large subunit ribosomal protein L23